MRFAVLAAAVAALWVQPAQAVTWALGGNINVREDGFEPCAQGKCAYTLFYSQPFSITVEDWYATQNGNVWTFSFSQNPRWSGGFEYIGNGEFKGLGVSFMSYLGGGGSCTNVTQRTACALEGRTSDFSVRQVDPLPMPEPTTWALMLLGFGAIGAAMRRRHVTSTLSSNFRRMIPWFEPR